ncbi:MAG: hypothetical protein ABIK89_15210 [Planctomycetota bacterium]
MPTLLVVSCVYLVVPYLIFLLGWLRWWLAVPMAALLVVASCCAVRDVLRVDPSGRRERQGTVISWRQLVLLIGAALFLALLSGAGGYGAQDIDYPKHNAILKALARQPWPVEVASPKGSFPLVYYIAWYLPAGLLGKVAGWQAANHVLFFWTVLGLVLALAWFCTLAGRFTWVVLAVFVGFSGLDVIGAGFYKIAALGGTTPSESIQIGFESLRWWNWEMRWWNDEIVRNYSPNVALLFLVPQQCLAGWILTGMIVWTLRHGGDSGRRNLWFHFGLSSLWAPFVTIGLAPLLAWDFFWRRPLGFRRWRAYASGANLCGLVVLGIVALYYVTRFADFPFDVVALASLHFGGPEHLSRLEFFFRMLLFLALEVGVIAWCVWRTGSVDDAESRGLFGTAVGFLLVLPWFSYGGCNDLVMRASIPCLFLVALFVARAIASPPSRRWSKGLLVFVLVLAAANPLAEIYRHAREVHRQGRLLALPAENDVKSLWMLNREYREIAVESDAVMHRAIRGDTFFLQYIGSRDALFFKYLAPPLIGAGVVGAGPSKHNQRRPFVAAVDRDHCRHERESRSVEQPDVVAPSHRTRLARPRPFRLDSPGSRSGLRGSGLVPLGPGRRG